MGGREGGRGTEQTTRGGRETRYDQYGWCPVKTNSILESSCIIAPSLARVDLVLALSKWTSTNSTKNGQNSAQHAL